MREKPFISPLIYLKVSLILLPHIVCQGRSRFKNVQDRNRHIFQDSSGCDVHTNSRKAWNQYFLRENFYDHH